MTKQIYPLPNYEKGLAKRAENFDAVLDNVRLIPMRPTPRVNLDRACAQGTPELSAGERCLMAFYLSHLSSRDQTAGKSSVWPGNWTASQALGVAPSTIRRQKAALEKKGLIIRKYDCRNRPLEEGAIDLRPFIVSASTRINAIEDRLQNHRNSWTEKRKAHIRSVMPECIGDYREDSEPRISTQASANDRLNTTYKYPVHEKDIFTKIEEGTANKNFTKQFPPLLSQKRVSAEQDLIDLCLKISPKLRNALKSDKHAIVPDQAAKLLYEALPVLFPKADQTSINHTMRWALKRYGIRIFECLAVTLEDPKVNNPEKYFGWLATTSDKVILDFALERVKRKNPPPLEIDLPTNPLGQTVATTLAKLIGAGKYNTWFSSQHTRFRQEGETLIIETAKRLSCHRMKTQMSADIRDVSERLEFQSCKIELVEKLSPLPATIPKLTVSNSTQPLKKLSLGIDTGAPSPNRTEKSVKQGGHLLPAKRPVDNTV